MKIGLQFLGNFVILSLKMQDIARKLDLTATEASRQLQRMSQAKLIERGPEGTYTTTQFGRLLLTLSASMDLVYKNDDYFLAHDLRTYSFAIC